ncbi:neurogenic locus notch homolog protein 1-like [Bolinopsis microptera]|uniref:neurogenic locus notch homolog protein 1-like n=1 Tax=Bolinopsis microptera TaxID=2820187 RepID=UPI00307AC3E8
MTGNRVMKLFFLFVGLAVSVEGQEPGCPLLDMMFNVDQMARGGDAYVYDFFQDDVVSISCYSNFIVPWIITSEETMADMKCMYDNDISDWRWSPWDADENVRKTFDQNWKFDKSQSSWEASHYICNECSDGAACNMGSCFMNKCECEGSLISDLEYPRECFKQQCQSPEVCKNGASCGENYMGVTCYCAKGFAGSNCEEIIDPCDDNPCENGGRCTTLEDGISFKCDCTGTVEPGYHGDTCQIEFDPCDDTPCENGGTCTKLEDGVSSNLPFKCDCTNTVEPGYHGDYCQIKNDPCDDNPCENGGTCTTLEDGISFKCDCSGTVEPGYHGDKCQTEDAKCPGDSDCGNGGSCDINPDNPAQTICKCPEGTTGIKCLEFISDPCSANPCQNEGTCARDENDFTKHKCTCVGDSSGDNCEVAAESHEAEYSSASAKTFLNLIAAQVILCLAF